MADKNFSVTFHQNPTNDFLRLALEKRTTINIEKNAGVVKKKLKLVKMLKTIALPLEIIQ